MTFTHIPDGYNLRAKFDAVDGLHGELEITYRPMMRSDRAALSAKVVRLADPAKAVELEVADVVDRIQAWSVPLPVDAAGFNSLPIPLQEKVLGVVWGSRPADSLEAVSPEETEATAAKN